MDNEMIERVAKALWDDYQSETSTIYGFSNVLIFGSEYAGKSVPWSVVISPEVIPYFADEYKKKAIAAIKAMREPTEKMMREGGMCLPDYDPSDEDAKGCWQRMIDAIINE